MHQAISDVFKRLSIGEPVSHKNLTVYPLVDGSSGEPDYLLLERALQEGLVSVTEVHGAGSVNHLKVTNQAKFAVLIMDGEELVGAKQNRVVNLTILVPAQQTIVIPLTCVEQGRWHHVSPQFRASRQAMPATMRARKSQQVFYTRIATGQAMADQAEMWYELDERQQMLNAFSPTSAMADIYARHEASLQDYERAIQPLEGQVGALFVMNGGIASLGVFDFTQTLWAFFPKLLRAAALDAISFFTPESTPISLGAVQDFVQRVAHAESQVYPAVGEGEDVRFRAAGIIGSALVARERMVHLCAFSSPEESGETFHSTMTRLNRPSERDRRMRR